jgi:hypothetical protein
MESENLAREMWHHRRAAIGIRNRRHAPGTVAGSDRLVGDERDDGVNESVPKFA